MLSQITNSSVGFLSRTWSSYASRREGNVAIIAALAIIPILVIIGGAVDFTRAVSAKNAIQVTLDSSVVAATKLNSKSPPAEMIEYFMQANMKSFSNEDINLTVDVQEAINGRKVTAVAKARINTTLLGLIGKETLEIEVNSTASQYILNTEVSLVLDVSSSMKGKRIASLKPAVNDFIDAILADDAVDHTSVNIIPFGGSVNIGDLFDDYVVDLASANVNPSESDYKNANFPHGNFRFTNGDKCLEYDENDFDIDELPANARSQIPHFWYWNNFNPYCPTDDSAVLLNTNDADALKNHVNGMTLSDGTGMEDGALWGLKSLSPQMRGKVGGDFSQRPLDFDTVFTNKVMILMADGGLTPQYRPEDYSRQNVHTNRSFNSTRNLGNGYSNTGNKSNAQIAIPKGNINSGTNRTVGRFLEACDNAKAEGIIVYTIGFQIRSSADKAVYKECATDDSYYFEVESLDIDQAFRAIAAAVDALRLEF